MAPAKFKWEKLQLKNRYVFGNHNLILDFVETVSATKNLLALVNGFLHVNIYNKILLQVNVL